MERARRNCNSAFRTGGERPSWVVGEKRGRSRSPSSSRSPSPRPTKRVAVKPRKHKDKPALTFSHPEVDDLEKWEIVMRLGTPMWPKYNAGNSKVNATAFEGLFSLPAMRHAKWYKELNVSKNMTAAEIEILKTEIEVRADMVSELISDARSFKDNGFKDLIVWMNYCIQEHDGDFAVDSFKKIRDFIPFRVEKALLNSGATKKYTPPEETAARAARYVQSRVGHLANVQGYFTIAEITNSREISSKTAKYRNAVVEARAKPQDYAGTSRVVTKRMTPEEEARVRKAYWESAKDFPSMRSYMLYMLNINAGQRGHELRELPMGALLHRTCPYVKPVACKIVTASVRHIKNCHNNNEHIISWVRTPDPEDCGIGAMANYFGFIFGVEKNSSLFDVMEEDLNEHIAWAEDGRRGPRPSSKWWKMYVAFASDEFSQISYDTHANGYKAAFQTAGIRKKDVVTHILRHMNVVKGLEKGEATTDLARHMRWYTNAISSAINAYTATATVVGTMMTQHNWDSMKDYECWREGPLEEVPKELLDLVFPRLRGMMELADKAYEMTEVDLSAVEFLSTLEYLAKVLLEDSLIMMERYPNFPVYKHPVFKTPIYEAWAEEEKKRVQQREDEYNFTKRDPDTDKVMKCIQRDQLKLRMLIEKMATPLALPAPAPASQEAPVVEEPKTKAFDPVPRIPDVASIKHAWNEWDLTIRPFFKTHANPAWQATYEDKKEIQRQKTSMDRLQPMCLYIDYLVETQGVTADEIITKLKGAREKLIELTGAAVSESTFVTEKMRNYIQRSANVPVGIKEALEAVGLPLPDKTSKEMRQLLWGRGKKK